MKIKTKYSAYRLGRGSRSRSRGLSCSDKGLCCFNLVMVLLSALPVPVSRTECFQLTLTHKPEQGTAPIINEAKAGA
ncbi:hypothetical protein BJX63DRAFT_340816 [Aspergillus granulosus]|uniref:Uncharacterized protein n=1 Tax=Aspergillus granulosus TaxID=176169 RepID=A0ABR4H4Y5_9EURO